MEREVRIFMQDERQCVHRRARSVHFKDICKKGESTYCSVWGVNIIWERYEKKMEKFLLTFVFIVLLFVYTPMCEREDATEQESMIK